METEAIITGLQFEAEQGLDVLSGDNSDLTKRISKFQKRYLTEGELVTEATAEDGSKKDKALKEIYQIAGDRQRKVFTKEYEDQYDRDYKDKYEEKQKKKQE